jgi:hypothetical protein
MNDIDKQKVKEHMQNNKESIKANAKKIERALAKRTVPPAIKIKV